MIEAGYTPDAGGETASRKSKSQRSKDSALENIQATQKGFDEAKGSSSGSSSGSSQTSTPTKPTGSATSTPTKSAEDRAVEEYIKTGSADVTGINNPNLDLYYYKAIGGRARKMAEDQAIATQQQQNKPMSNKELIDKAFSLPLEYRNFAERDLRPEPIQARKLIAEEMYKRGEAPIKARIEKVSVKPTLRQYSAIPSQHKALGIDKIALQTYPRPVIVEKKTKAPKLSAEKSDPDYSPAGPTNYEKRVRSLMEREQNLQKAKDWLYDIKIPISTNLDTGKTETFSLSRDQNVTYIWDPGGVKETLKAGLRFPIEAGSLAPMIGGRIALAGESLFYEEGRAELWSGLKQTPKATLKGMDPRTPEGLVNLGAFALGVKSQASNPPAFISKRFKGYTPFEEAGFKVTEGMTEPYSFKEIVKTQGQEVTGIHATFKNPFEKNILERVIKPGKYKETITVEAYPENAGPFRQSFDQFSFYKSLPDKASLLFEGEVNPQAYGGYIGIGPGESGSQTVFSIGAPKRSILRFQEEHIQPVSSQEWAMTSKGLVSGGKQILEYQQLPENLGKSFLAPENIIKASTEGQYTSPVGSELNLKGSGTFTLYRPPSKIKNTVFNWLQEKTGIGLKTYRLDIFDVETANPFGLEVKPTQGGGARSTGPGSQDTFIPSSQKTKTVEIPVAPPIIGSGSLKSSSGSRSSINTIFSIPRSQSQNIKSSSLSLGYDSTSKIFNLSPSKPSSSGIFSSVGISSSRSRASSSRSSSRSSSSSSRSSSASSGSFGSSGGSLSSIGSSLSSSVGISSGISSPSRSRSPSSPSKGSSSLFFYSMSREIRSPSPFLFRGKTPGPQKAPKFKPLLSLKPKYQPTIKSVFFGETGPSPKGQLTGLEERFIPTPKKKKKNKSRLKL